MNFIEYILNWARAKGYGAEYANPALLEEKLGNCDFLAHADGVCVFMHLITAQEWVNGHDQAIVAVYFAKLCPFDFEPENLLTVQDDLTAKAKALLVEIGNGNQLTWEKARFAYGYDDFAENVAWCCLRVTLTASAADCIPMTPEPEP